MLQNGISVMKAYLKIWSNYSMLVKLLVSMFENSNKNYHLENSNLETLGVTALEIFNQDFY